MKGLLKMWFAKLLDLLHIRRAVWLLHFDGEVTMSWISQDTPFGKIVYRYPIYRVGPMLLEEDGTLYYRAYIRSWEYYRKW